MLYTKKDMRTPLLRAIGGRTKYTNSVEFVLGQNYTAEEGEIPSISETASLTAPKATFITREQNTNVTQIFMESVAISYAKQSNMGTLAGINISGQTANPSTELDFQIARKMEKNRRSIEKTFIQGTFSEATQDTEVNKTRGLIEAITSNTLDLKGNSLDIWAVNDMLIQMKQNNADITGLTLWLDAVTLNQLNGSAVEYGVPVGQPYSGTYGIQIRDLLLPSGTVSMALGEFLPAGTILVLNLGALSPVEQVVPGKGNFFLEPLAKTGAGEKYQLFGQIGLDYGAEHLHGKITNIATTFTKPVGRKVMIVSPEASGALLEETPVAKAKASTSK